LCQRPCRLTGPHGRKFTIIDSFAPAALVELAKNSSKLTDERQAASFRIGTPSDRPPNARWCRPPAPANGRRSNPLLSIRSQFSAARRKVLDGGTDFGGGPPGRWDA
jgi:hypothetical protein